MTKREQLDLLAYAEWYLSGASWHRPYEKESASVHRGLGLLPGHYEGVW